MKPTRLLFLLTALLASVCCITLHAVTARIEVSFDANANPAGTEFFVEQKVGATYTEVAKGAVSPVVFTLPNVPPGTTVTVRVKARLPSVPGSDSAPTADASGIVPLNAPKNISLAITVPTVP